MDFKLRCVFEESIAEAPQSSPQPQPQPQRPQAAASPESAASGDKSELKTLLEECKRLQAENASLKQNQSEMTYKEPTKQVPTNDLYEEMRKQLTLFACIAFVVGVVSGYILF